MGAHHLAELFDFALGFGRGVARSQLLRNRLHTTPRHSCHVKPQRPSLEPQRCVAVPVAAAAAVAERTVRRCASAWRQMEMRSSLSSVPSTSCAPNTSTPSASDPSTSKQVCSGEVKDQSEICHQEVNNGDQKPPGETRGLSSTVCSGEARRKLGLTGV